MAEMLVNLRVLRDLETVLDEQRARGVEVRRARTVEGSVIADWVRENINPNWGVVAEVALEQMPPACFVAHRKNPADQSLDLSPENILGFACYDVVTRGVFGPSGVREDQQKTDVGTALLLACLHAMAAEEYTQAVIGWSGLTVGYSG
jgi:hypothetical protein